MEESIRLDKDVWEVKKVKVPKKKRPSKKQPSTEKRKKKKEAMMRKKFLEKMESEEKVVELELMEREREGEGEEKEEEVNDENGKINNERKSEESLLKEGKMSEEERVKKEEDEERRRKREDKEERKLEKDRREMRREKERKREDERKEKEREREEFRKNLSERVGKLIYTKKEIEERKGKDKRRRLGCERRRRGSLRGDLLEGTVTKLEEEILVAEEMEVKTMNKMIEERTEGLKTKGDIIECLEGKKAEREGLKIMKDCLETELGIVEDKVKKLELEKLEILRTKPQKWVIEKIEVIEKDGKGREGEDVREEGRKNLNLRNDVWKALLNKELEIRERKVDELIKENGKATEIERKKIEEELFDIVRLEKEFLVLIGDERRWNWIHKNRSFIENKLDLKVMKHFEDEINVNLEKMKYGLCFGWLLEREEMMNKEMIENERKRKKKEIKEDEQGMFLRNEIWNAFVRKELKLRERRQESLRCVEEMDEFDKEAVEEEIWYLEEEQKDFLRLRSDKERWNWVSENKVFVEEELKLNLKKEGVDIDWKRSDLTEPVGREEIEYIESLGDSFERYDKDARFFRMKRDEWLKIREDLKAALEKKRVLRKKIIETALEIRVNEGEEGVINRELVKMNESERENVKSLLCSVM